jgi:hypothetical protein
MTANIFQIYYSNATKSVLDPGFLPLDNSSNERPDWREYWPIRRYLLENSLVDGDYYGFLSPAFKEKTGLTAAAVVDFVERGGGEPEVVLFSPFYDLIAFFLNQWEQGGMTHSNQPLFERSLELVAPDFNMYDTASTALNSVFCNYFVAKPAFWRAWLERCERVFSCAELADTALGQALSEGIDYKSEKVPAKVFVIERVASALLATQPRWQVSAYNPMLLPFSHSTVNNLGEELVALDALKIAFSVDPRQQYKRAFFQLRAKFAQMNRLRR